MYVHNFLLYNDMLCITTRKVILQSKAASDGAEPREHGQSSRNLYDFKNSFH